MQVGAEFLDILYHQDELGYMIISKVNALSSRHDKSKLQDIATMWLKLYENYQKLKVFGIHDEKYFSEIEAAIIKFQERFPENSCPENAAKEDDKETHNAANEECSYSSPINDKVVRFLKDINDFKEFMIEKEMKLESCVCPDVIWEELKLRFEILREDSRSTAVKDDEISQDEFRKMIKKYFDIILQVREKIHKQTKHRETLLEEPANTEETNTSESKEPIMLDEPAKEDDQLVLNDTNDVVAVVDNTVMCENEQQAVAEVCAVENQQEILEDHIRNIQNGVPLKTLSGEILTLNHYYPGLSEDAIRQYYACADTPTSLKAFVTPLLQQANWGFLLENIFPEDGQ